MFGREMVWYFGNGDSVVGKETVEYQFKEELAILDHVQDFSEIVLWFPLDSASYLSSNSDSDSFSDFISFLAAFVVFTLTFIGALKVLPKRKIVN